MTKDDFEFDRAGFADFLERRDLAAEIAKRNLWDVFGCWVRLSEDKLGGRVKIFLGEVGERVTGNVLGKVFHLDVGVQACETCSMLEIVLSAPSLCNGQLAEIDRFLIAPSGEVLSSENETVFASAEPSYSYDEDGLNDSDTRSYDILIAVLRKVIKTPLML